MAGEIFTDCLLSVFEGLKMIFQFRADIHLHVYQYLTMFIKNTIELTSPSDCFRRGTTGISNASVMLKQKL